MAQTSYGTITITDITDISDVYLEYALVSATIDTPEAVAQKTTWTPPERSWSTTPPTWQSGYQIWVRRVTQKEGVNILEYGMPYLDSASSQLNARIDTEAAERQALASKLKKIWVNLNPTSTYPAGTYAAAGVNNGDITESNSSTYGFNTWLNQEALRLRYNAINLTALSTSGLSLYYPIVSNNVITNSGLGAQLTSTGLRFYKPTTSGTTGANTVTLNSNGLEISEGTIRIDSFGSNNGYVYLSTHNESHIVNGIDKDDWRLVLGDTFAVNKDGYMTASEGLIGGDDYYIRLEKETTTQQSSLEICLNKLNLRLDDIYGRENIVNVLDIVSQQIDFINLWTGTQTWKHRIWEYYHSNDTEVIEGKTYYTYSNNTYSPVSNPSGAPKDNGYYEYGRDYTVYPYSDEEGQITYYYDTYEFNETQSYMRTSDTTVEAGKEYYQYTNSSYVLVSNPTGNPYSKGYYELMRGIYQLSNDTSVNINKNYYTRSGSSPNYVYTYVETPGGNPHTKPYYEFIEENWVQLDSVDETTAVDIYGLQKSLKYTADGNGNLQRLVVSSASEDEGGGDKAWVEIDQRFINFAIRSDDMQSLELKLQYDSNITNTASINVLHGEETIFDIADNSNYMLNTQTGFKLGGLGMFHYKNGLAIGIV